MKKLYIVLFTGSVLLNIFLLYIFNFKTAYFFDSHFWQDSALSSSGVLIFNNSSEQPNTKRYIQYMNIKCRERECKMIEGDLIDSMYINNIESYDLEIEKLSYQDKEAIFRHKDCLFTLNEKTTSFNCNTNGVSGVLGSHVKLHFEQNSLF